VVIERSHGDAAWQQSVFCSKPRPRRRPWFRVVYSVIDDDLHVLADVAGRTARQAPVPNFAPRSLDVAPPPVASPICNSDARATAILLRQVADSPAARRANYRSEVKPSGSGSRANSRISEHVKHRSGNYCPVEMPRTSANYENVFLSWCRVE